MGKYGDKGSKTSSNGSSGKVGTDVPLQTAAPAEPAAKKKGFTSASALAAGSASNYVPAFEKVTENRDRIVAATMAQQKRGKTRFAFTLPKKWQGRSGLAYLQLDNNYEHALKAARAEYGKDTIHHLSYTSTDPRGDLQSDAKRRWERFITDYDYCVRKMAGVIVDTMTELNDLRKIAEHGRNSQILQIFYGSIYSDYRWMVTHALQNDANVLFLHRMKDEYLNNNRTGNLKLDGWTGIAYETQMLLEHSRDDDGVFTTTIREAAQDAMLIGCEFTSKDDDNDFANIAARVYPETDVKDWQKK